MMILRIYLKEIKDLVLRDKKTLLVSVLVPLVFMVGIVIFQEYQMGSGEIEEAFSVAVSDDMDDEAYAWLNEIPYVEATRTEDPEMAVERGEIQVALDADADFMQHIEDQEQTVLTIGADLTSRDAVQHSNYLREQLNVTQMEIVQERVLAEGLDPGIVSPYQVEVQSYTGADETLVNLSFLFTIIVLMSVMIGMSSTALDIVAGEKVKHTMESLLLTPVKRIYIIVSKWLTIATVGVLSGCISILGFLLLTTQFSEVVSTILPDDEVVSLLSSALVGVVLFSLMFAAVLLMISILSPTTKAAQNYIAPVMFAVMIPGFIIADLSPNELLMSHYFIPVMNIFTLLKELIFGVFSLNSLLYVAGSTSIYILIVFLAANWMFKKDKWVLGKS